MMGKVQHLSHRRAKKIIDTLDAGYFADNFQQEPISINLSVLKGEG